MTFKSQISNLRFLLFAGVLASACAPPPRPAPEGLQQAAERALGGREGTVLVMDPEDGRLRAVVNPRLAFEQAFPPGSAIKPFTALAALRAGLVDRDSRRACRGGYAGRGTEIACSHPRSASPFDLPRALAYSCNDYFGHLGERLSEGAFHATLASFGFGARTGVNAGGEAAGGLPSGEWGPAAALGEGDRLLVTPVQLLAAYAALVNGGRLHRPRQGEAPTEKERARLPISPAHRALLLAGMRSAVGYGTAAGAGLVGVFGKTGTSTASDQYRTQGWFVGFTEDGRLAVLVFLRRAHGSDCAAVARPIFEAYTGLGPAVAGPQGQEGQPVVKVRRVSEAVTEQLPLEEYIAGVLAAEAGAEGEAEALKAQAVASRTFALRNLGRHAREGYDLCSTTHCQRYVAARGERGRGAAGGTAGTVLRDRAGQLVDAYFHAACGGATADLEALWGEAAPPYLRGVTDDSCATMPHRRWEQVVPEARLAAALRGDARSDVGARLDRIVVAHRDAGGRAEWVALEGERRRLLRGWDFKIIVGRALGWDVLKSSRFEVARAGADFVFRGSGFGHGLGLCQEGAHVLARRGASYEQILSHYYPGTVLGNEEGGAEHGSVGRDGSAWIRPVVMRPPRADGRLSLASEHFRASFPAGADRGAVEEALRALEAARADLRGRLAAAGMRPNEPGVVELFAHETTADFIAATGQPGWVAAVTRGLRIETQPLGALRRRGALATTLRHEYAHTVIEALGRAPRWLAEGLAAHVAGEGAALARVKTDLHLSRGELERRLARPASAAEMRALYAAAYREVLARIRAEGESTVWRRVGAGG